MLWEQKVTRERSQRAFRSIVGKAIPGVILEEILECDSGTPRAGASQRRPRRRSGSCPGGGVGASQQLPRRRSGSSPTIAQEEEWELPSSYSGGGVRAAQRLLRRSGSFPAAAQEEEWELPNCCPGDGVGAVWCCNTGMQSGHMVYVAFGWVCSTHIHVPQW